MALAPECAVSSVLSFSRVITQILASILLLFAPEVAIAQSSTLAVPPMPQGKAFWSMGNDDFTVRVRVPGGEWRDLYEFDVRVDNDRPSHASMVFFQTSGPVEVAVRKNNGDVRRVEVRPVSARISPVLRNDTAYFTLSGPRKLSVEFDGNRLNNLHLFAGALRPAPPAPSKAGVTVFGPGIHLPPDGSDYFRFASNQDVHLADGAILSGGIELRDVKNVRVVGNGIIAGAKKEGIMIADSVDITIDGPMVLNPVHYSVQCGASRGVTIRDFKAFSQGSWTDGLDFMSCSDVRVDDVFMRNSDDTIAIYGGRWDFSGDARNYLVTNSVLWADVAHAVNIGLHGTPNARETIEDITFRNIDILEHDEDDPDYQGALAISDGDNNLVRRVRFEDIRVDRIEQGALFNVKALYNQKYSHAPGRGIEDIVLRNILFRGDYAVPSKIAGFDPERGVRGVVIENVSSDGRRLARDDLDIGPNVSGVIVK